MTTYRPTHPAPAFTLRAPTPRRSYLTEAVCNALARFEAGEVTWDEAVDLSGLGNGARLEFAQAEARRFLT